MELQINGKTHSLQADGAMPLLWVLRDVLNMTGTKFGCGVAACGACTVRVDGAAVRSCVTPVSTVVAKQIQTIEGLGATKLHALQEAWIAEQVPQCGYCQSGMLMAAASLLDTTPQPTDAQIDAVMTNICRCGTYQRVRAAIHRAAGTVKTSAQAPSGGSAVHAVTSVGAAQVAAGPPQGAQAPSGGSAVHAVTSVGAAQVAAGPPQGAQAPSGGSAVHAVTSVGAIA